MTVSLAQLASSTNRNDGATIATVTIHTDAKVAYFWEGSRRTNDTTEDGWILSATCDGQAMSSSDAYDFITRERTRLWYLIDPPTGASKAFVVQRVNDTNATRAVSQVAEIRDTVNNKYRLKSVDGDGEPNSGTSISQTTTDNVETTDVLIYAHQVYNASGTSTSAGTGETQLATTEDALLVLGHGYNISGSGSPITVDSNHDFGSARSQNMVVALFELDPAAGTDGIDVSDSATARVVCSTAPTVSGLVKTATGIRLSGTADGVHASAWFRRVGTGPWIRLARFDAGVTNMEFLDESAEPNVTYSYRACHLDAEDNTCKCTGTFTQTLTGLVQEGGRFRNDDGSETTATWITGQDANISLNAGQRIRIRILLDARGNPPSQQYRITGGLITEPFQRIPVRP